MTKKITKELKCRDCGNPLNFEFFDSINTHRSPELKERVLSRDINNFYCNSCNGFSELIYPFLYADSDNMMFIWCFPEFVKNEENMRQWAENKYKKEAEATKDLIPEIHTEMVYGYDELLAIINKT